MALSVNTTITRMMDEPDYPVIVLSLIHIFTGDQYLDNDVSEFIRDIAEEQQIGVETDFIRVRLYQPIASKENTFYCLLYTSRPATGQTGMRGRRSRARSYTTVHILPHRETGWANDFLTTRNF